MALLNYVGFRSLACLMVLLTVMLFGLSNLTLPRISLSSSSLFLPVNCMILALLASGGFFSRNALVVSEACNNACVSVSFSSDGNSSALALRREADYEGAIVVSCEYVEEKTIVCIDDRAFVEDSLVVCDNYPCYDDRSLVPCEEDFAHGNPCRELVPTLESVSSMDSECVGDDDSCRSLVTAQPSSPTARKKTKKTKKTSSCRRKKVENKDPSGEDWIVRTTDRAVKVDLENLSQQEFNNAISSFIDLRRKEWLLIGNAP